MGGNLQSVEEQPILTLLNINNWSHKIILIKNRENIP